MKKSVEQDISNARPGAGSALAARPDIAKCAGAGLPCCALCVRNLEPAGKLQQWAGPIIDGATCTLFASVLDYGHLYGASSAPRKGGTAA
jgi:hypothetical protein